MVSYYNPLSVDTIMESRFLTDLATTRSVGRLANVSFLGAIDYHKDHSGHIMHTRYQHSLGVLRLALGYCDAVGLNERNRKEVCAAALLHDIGHPPLSHSAESVFDQRLDIDHHQATRRIIKGVASPVDDIVKTLRKHNVDLDRVASLASQNRVEFDGFFGGPINFDTIEGVSRSASYFEPADAIPDPMDVMLASLNRSEEDERTVDDFWKRKHRIYNQLVHSESGIAADFAAQQVLRKHFDEIETRDFFGTDNDLFRKMPELKTILRDPEHAKGVTKPISYVARRYFVDPAGDFRSGEDQTRYQHTKQRVYLSQCRTASRSEGIGR